MRTWPQAQPQSDNETVEPRYNEHPYDQHPSLRSVSFSPLPLHSSLFALVPIFSTNSRGNASFAGYQHPNISNDWNSPTQQFFHSLGNDSLYSPFVPSPIIHPVCIPKFSITFVCNENLKAMLMQNLGAGGGGWWIRCITMVRMTNKNKKQRYWNYHKTQHIERKQKHTEINPAFSRVLLFNRNSQAVITPSL